MPLKLACTTQPRAKFVISHDNRELSCSMIVLIERDFLSGKPISWHHVSCSHKSQLKLSRTVGTIPLFLAMPYTPTTSVSQTHSPISTILQSPIICRRPTHPTSSPTAASFLLPNILIHLYSVPLMLMDLSSPAPGTLPSSVHHCLRQSNSPQPFTAISRVQPPSIPRTPTSLQRPSPHLRESSDTSPIIVFLEVSPICC